MAPLATPTFAGRGGIGAGWSTYLNGNQVDFEQFKKEIQTACAYVRSKQKGKAKRSRK